MAPIDTEARVYLVCVVILLVAFVAAAAAAVRSLTVADREEQRRLKAERQVAHLTARLAFRSPGDVDEAYRTVPLDLVPAPVTAPWASAPPVLLNGVRREHGGLW